MPGSCAHAVRIPPKILTSSHMESLKGKSSALIRKESGAEV